MEEFETNTANILEGRELIKHHIDREETQDVKVITNFASQEPYLFFYPESNEMSHVSPFVHPNYRYYRYLAFNSGFGNSKKAIFKKLGYIELSNGRDDKNIEDVVNISKEIPIEALNKLHYFINEKRNPESNIFEKNTYCKTIYDAVVKVVNPQQQNN